MRKDKYIFSESTLLILEMKLWVVCGVDFKYLIIDLFIVQLGVHIGDPYKTIGLINESKRVLSALKDSFDRITVRFNTKKGSHCFQFQGRLSSP